MNKFKFYFIVFCSLFTLFSCNKADDKVYEPLRFYSDQYVTDLALIEDYLNTHYIAQIVNHPGFSDDQDIVMSEIPAGDTTKTPIMNDPLLHSTEILFNNFTYKVYYIQLREGVGTKPVKVDQILVSYDGSYLSRNSAKAINTRFQYVQFPEGFFALNGTIPGWPDMITLFKTGVVEAGEGPNPSVYNDFGAGVMFLPSALGYYNLAQTEVLSNVTITTIPAYSPLIFSFKLYDSKHVDNDGDGIFSNDEDVNHDGDFTNDDTDGDGIQNYLDNDDDGDGYLTKNETKKPAGENSGSSAYYPYSPIVDDPSTPDVDETETKGVPDCSGNFTATERLRKYLDPNCH